MSGITESGFVVATEAEVFDAIAAEARATISPSLDVAPDSVFGQIAGIVASKHAELWEVLEAVWGALGESGSSAALDRVAALTNTFRQVGESDAAFRIRRRQELSDQGATTAPAMRAALSRLSGMTAVRVICNRTMVTDAAGRPPKSVEALTLGTTAETLIAHAIWDNLAAGIETHGTTTSAVTDSEGHTQVIKYSVATAAHWWVRLSAEVDEGSYAGDEALRQRIVDFSSGALTLQMSDGSYIASGVDLGAILYRSRLAAAALTVAGVTAVTQVQFSEDGTSWVDADKPLGPRQFLSAKDVDVLPVARGFDPERVMLVRT